MSHRWSARPRRVAVTVVAIGLAATLAACGSNINPNDLAQAGGTAAGQPGTVLPDGSTVPGTSGDPGATGGDPGTAGSPGTTDPGAPGAPGTPGDPAAPGEDGGTPPLTTEKGNCSGFKNGPGITDSTITIGNASDISGPIPGLFETAQQGVAAFVAYFNATEPDGICGRKLALKTYDSRTDAAADQQAYTAGCDDTFAMVGSVSAFDSGGAATAEKCGLPDLRGGSTTAARYNCSTCFGAQGVDTKFFENAVPDFVKSKYASSADNVGYLYINAGAAAENGKAQVKAMTKRGLKFDYVQAVDISEINYVPFVQQLKDKKIEVVFWTGAYSQSARLRKAMATQNYKPKLYLRDPTDYNPAYVEEGGSAVDGTVVFTNFTPFEEAGSNREMALYLSYLDQVKPGATPQFFGVFAWSAARLFVEKAIGLGGKLNRASLISAVRATKDWTSEGLHAPQPVGSKGTGECWRFIQLDGTQWKPVGGTKYSCSGVTSSS